MQVELSLTAVNLYFLVVPVLCFATWSGFTNASGADADNVRFGCV